MDLYVCALTQRKAGWAQALIDSNQEGLYSLEVKMAFLFYAAYLYHLAIHRYFLMHYYCNFKKQTFLSHFGWNPRLIFTNCHFQTTLDMPAARSF